MIKINKVKLKLLISLTQIETILATYLQADITSGILICLFFLFKI